MIIVCGEGGGENGQKWRRGMILKYLVRVSQGGANLAPPHSPRNSQEKNHDSAWDNTYTHVECDGDRREVGVECGGGERQAYIPPAKSEIARS